MIRNSTSLATTYFSRPLYNLTSFRLTRNVSSNLDIEKLEKESTDAQIEGVSDEVIKRELEIERKRNKSRLRTADHMILHEKSPFIEPNYWYQGTLRYKRRLYGRYGAESGVDPAICWPVKQELEDAKEYERVAHPFTIPQMMEMAKEARLAKEKEWRVRQEQVLAKMEKLEDWKADFLARTKAKEQQAREARVFTYFIKISNCLREFVILGTPNAISRGSEASFRFPSRSER